MTEFINNLYKWSIVRFGIFCLNFIIALYNLKVYNTYGATINIVLSIISFLFAATELKRCISDLVGVYHTYMAFNYLIPKLIEATGGDEELKQIHELAQTCNYEEFEDVFKRLEKWTHTALDEAED